jgi:outer membrane lipoprotein SlyB
MGNMNRLKVVANPVCGWLVCLGLMPLLNACAESVPSGAQAAALTGGLHLGTVVSVRPATFDGDNAAAQKILATLDVPAPAEQEAVELVIREQNNSVISVVQPAGPGQPGFVTGEPVLIVENGTTVVRPR